MGQKDNKKEREKVLTMLYAGSIVSMGIALILMIL